jgi:hypothetical protein
MSSILIPISHIPSYKHWVSITQSSSTGQPSQSLKYPAWVGMTRSIRGGREYHKGSNFETTRDSRELLVVDVLQ